MKVENIIKMLIFEQVNFYHLKPNKKYRITDLNGTFHYTGKFSNYRENIAFFKEVVCINPIERDCGYVTFSYNIGRKFYSVKSKKQEIQQSMETRAINKIIHEIIGDNCFKWL